MTPQCALESILALPRFSRGNTLEPVRALLHALRDPQRGLRFIHVAGTNGKGSISTMCSAILQEAGLRVGLFTSPYIEHFRERFQINGQAASPDAFAKAATAVLTAMKKLKQANELSQFDVVTAIGFLYFAIEKCDVVVLECGLGGRLDATNVIEPPCVAVIGNIGFDHTELLGDSIEAITKEKCGILKPGTGAVVCAPQDYPAAAETIKAVAAKQNIPLFAVQEDTLFLLSCHLGALSFSYRGEAYTTRLAAAYQGRNAAAAIEAMRAWQSVTKRPLLMQAVRDGLAQAFIPARLERASLAPLVLLDGGHNIDGLRALRTSMEAVTDSFDRLFCLVGMLREKAPDQALSAFFSSLILREKLGGLYTMTPNTPRACPAKELADILQQLPLSLPRAIAYADPKEALDACLSAMGPQDALLCFGSLYSMGELRRILREPKKEKR